MATPKPPILTTNFFRAVRSCRPQTYRSICSPPASAARQRRLLTQSTRLRQEADYQRYGPAATPTMPPPPKPAEPYLPSTEQTRKDASDTELKRTERKKKQAQAKEEEEKQAANQQKQQEEQTAQEEEEAEAEEEPQEESQRELAPEEQEIMASEAKPEESEATPNKEQLVLPDEEGPLPNRELDMILSIPTPNEVKSDASQEQQQHHQHPHLEASPYEHHFDTYTLVQDLCNENPENPLAPSQLAFSSEQAITLMKSIRLMLASNLDLAKDGLVSKSDTENETYLFRAACSELKTTMQTSRFMEAQKQRSQRAQLQHEFDILNQKVSQDIMTMREELKAMFNDRKLHLQEEKRQVDGKIQSLSYRISVDLNSEAKSEVEGLRWVLTRRAALAIGAAASMVLVFLQYYSVKAREQAEIEKKRKVAQKEQDARLKRESERFGSSGATVGRGTGTQSEGIVLGGTAGSGNYEDMG